MADLIWIAVVVAVFLLLLLLVLLCVCLNRNRSAVNYDSLPVYQNRPPVYQNRPPVYQDWSPVHQNWPPVHQDWPPVDQNWPPVDQNRRFVDINRLETILNGILREYRTDGMFSLAVRIPENQNQYPEQILQQVFDSDPGNTVKYTINSNQVYTGNRVVAAKVLQWQNGGADHAESRVVDHLDHLFNRPDDNDNDLLLFFVYASPCDEKCLNYTHPENILQRIRVMCQLKNRAFVFQKPFRPSSGQLISTEQERIDALQRLGTAIGRENIFRYDWGRCTRCFIGGQVDPHCFRDN